MKSKFRYYFRFITQFFKRFGLLIGFSLLIGVLIFITISYLFSNFLSKKKEYIGVIGKYTKNNLPASVNNLSTKTFIQVSTLTEISDDGKKWHFVINKDFKWQDGSNLTSKNINLNFENVRLSIIDTNKLEFILPESYSPFGSVLNRPLYKDNLIGLGSWKIIKINYQRDLVSEIILSDAKNNKKIYRVYSTEDQARLAFKLGKIDKIENIYDLKELQNYKNVKITKKTNYNNIAVLFFNLQDSNLAEKNNRLILNYAIDKTGFKDNRALGPISPENWAYNSAVKPYNYDPEKAKELLKSGKMKIEITTSSFLLGLAEKIIDDWKKIGIDAVVAVRPEITNEYQSYLTILSIPDDPDQYSLWHSTQEGTNYSKLKNPRIDKLLEDGRVEMNQEKRKKIYLDFQRFLNEESPAVFLYYVDSYMVERK